MSHDRGRCIDHPVIHCRARQKLVRCVHKAVDITFHQRFIRTKGDKIAQLLYRAFDHDRGKINRVMAVFVQNRLGAVFAIGVTHRFKISRDCRIIGMDGMVHTCVTMSVGPCANAHVFKKFIRRHEGRDDLHRRRAGFRISQFFPDFHGRSGRAFMGDHRMTGVGLVFDQHFPVAFVHIAKRGARDLQPACRGAIHHIVNRG